MLPSEAEDGGLGWISGYRVPVVGADVEPSEGSDRFTEPISSGLGRFRTLAERDMLVRGPVGPLWSSEVYAA